MSIHAGENISVPEIDSLSNSYDRELVSRQSMGLAEDHQLPHPDVSPVPCNRPKTATQPALSQTNGRVHFNIITGRPSSHMCYGKTTHSLRKPLKQTDYHRPPSQSGYRPPSQLGYRPPSQSGYRPGSQSGYRPPSQLGFRPPSQSGYRPSSKLNHHHDMAYQDQKYLADDPYEMVYPEPTQHDEDQQIFVRKPKQTTVTPPMFRLGSHGAPWKHVKSVISSSGSHICWIDGNVKQEENMFFPMYWNRDPPQRMYRVQKPKMRLNNSYNQRTNNGYRLQGIPATKYTDYSKMPLHSYQPTCRV